MSSVSKYRFWCVTEAAYVYVWVDTEDAAPTLCPNDSAHEVDLTNQVVVDVVADTDVRIAAVGDGLELPEKSVSLPTRPGQSVFHKGYSFVAQPGTVTEHMASYTDWMMLQGMGFRACDNAFGGDLVTAGDSVDAELVDVNGVTGYPAGTVLGAFGSDLQVWPGREFQRICEDAKQIPPTVAIRFRYTSRGATAVRFHVEHILRTMA